MEPAQNVTTSGPLDILKRFWGFDAFRLRQSEVVNSILSGKDTLVLLPTGGGKSICFQVPVLMKEGIGIVISPLVALMHDQVDSLNRKGIRSYALTSLLSRREMDIILDNCIYGNVKFLYVSPERLQNEMFQARLQKMKVNLIAVDEAHCISQWGYDFRPAYLDIAAIRTLRPGVPLLALTATATTAVVDDIQDKLLFPVKNVIASGFERVNLAYVVYKVEDKEDKLLEVCRNVKGSGIVYCGSRNRTKEVADFLKKNKITATWYHAGLENKQRKAAQNSWFKGTHRVICATNAFGMGIDKPDVRFVVHMDVPADPESYFQEAGRAGRDGKKAYALLMYQQHDLEMISKKIEVQFPPGDYIAAVYRAICNHFKIATGAGEGQVFPFDLGAICKQYSLKFTEAYYAVMLLDRSGYISVNDGISEPARMMFTVARTALYNYQVMHPEMDSFIKLLLRMYGGLFEQYIVIREEDISRKSGMAVGEIKEKLQMLGKHSIADYKPRSDDAKITFVISRLRENHLRIPDEVYADRKTSAIRRAQSMRSYLESFRCRSIQLLEYFGERHSEPCGKCDVCNHKRQSGFDITEYEKMSEAIIAVLLHEPVSIDDLPKKLSRFHKDKIIRLVRWKMDQNEIIMRSDMRLALPGM